MNPYLHQTIFDFWIAVYRERFSETRSPDDAAKCANAAVESLRKFTSTL